MPAEMERRLREEVDRRHPDWSAERKNAYVYGALRNTGWKPSWKPKREKPSAR